MTRRRTTSAMLASLAVTSLLVLTPGASQAEPSIDTVQQRVGRLYHEAEQASERYDLAREKVRKARTRLDAVSADLRRERSAVADLRADVARDVVMQSQGQGLETLRGVFSNDPDTFLERLAADRQASTVRAQMISDLAQRLHRLDQQEESASRTLATVRDLAAKMASDKKEIDAKAAAAKQLLDKLKAEERARVIRASRAAERAAASSTPSPSPAPTTSSTPAPSVPASGKAQAAVDFAMAQVGKPYVYGAAGPDAYDCSGLTMAAWAAAGVSLPHSSSAQMSYGTPVSESQLQPGDLVFYYSPVSHVGMYIGNGKIVNAENPSVGIVVAPLHLMPYVGAVRPG